MNQLLKEIRHNPLLWLLAFVPEMFSAAKLKPEAHALLFVLSALAIVPLAALLSHATESLAVKTGDAVSGLFNATPGKLTELVIALTALRAGQYMPVMVISSRAKTCMDLWFSYGLTPVHEPARPLSWNAYVKDWLRRHELAGNFAILTHRSPADDPAGNHRMEIVNL